MAGMGKFDWADPFLLDEQLSEDERMIRDTARAYAQDRLAPRIVEAFQHEHTDPAIFREMGELGLLGPTVPEEYGGVGASYVAYGLVAREVERIDSGYRSMMSVQSSLVMYPIFSYGNEQQKQAWLPKLQSGRAIGCFGLTEPGFGSNPAGMLTTAKRDGADWVLNGEKTWITNGSIADVAVVWARAEEGIVGFLPITLVEDDQAFMWVSGIPNGSRVIVQGQDFVREGQRVESTIATEQAAVR